MNIAITAKTITNPDFTGWNFYVEAGKFFDEADYREAMRIKPGVEIDDQSVKAAQDASAHLNTGEWLEVGHQEVE